MTRPATAGAPRETAAAKAQRAAEIARRLAERYPGAVIPLHHHNALELLVATILSAQCTDARVNAVTPALFRRYRTAADFAGARRTELETLIRSTGFYRAKARAIQDCCRMLIQHHGGQVPRTMEELTRLPGVGRKTANVVLSLFDVPGIVVDTHVRRLSRRLGLTEHDDPDTIEQDLMRLLPPEMWSLFSLRLIYLGREVCAARRPRCPICPLRSRCPSARYAGMPPWMARRTAAVKAVKVDTTRTGPRAGRSGSRGGGPYRPSRRGP
jgi:endonuclease-3